MDIFKRIFKRTEKRGLETQTTPIATSTGLFNLGNTSAVDKDNVLTIPAFFAAVNLLSNTISTLPIHVLSNKGGKTTKMSSHPVSRLLSKKPNPYMAPSDFKHPLQMDLCIHGNAFAHIVKAPNGNVKELWPLDASRMVIEANNRELRYIYYSPEGQRAFRPDELLHLRFAPEMGLVGRSPLELFKQSLGIALAGQETAAVYMSQGATLSGVLEVDKFLDPENRAALKDGWKRMFTGAKAAGEVAILHEGMTYKPLSINVRDLQFLESRQFQITEIARIFNIQPHLIGDLERSTNNNIEQQGLEFIKYTLLPWICRWEAEINSKLFSDDTTYVKFNVSALARGEMEARTRSYRTLFEIGAITRNEIRELEDMNVLEDEDSNLPHTPVNVIPSDILRNKEQVSMDAAKKASEEPQVVQEAPTPDTEDKALTDTLESVKRACTKTIKGKFTVAMTNILKRCEGDEDKARAQTAKFFDTNLLYCERTFEPYFNLDSRADTTIATKVHNSLFDKVMELQQHDNFIEKLTQLING